MSLDELRELLHSPSKLFTLCSETGGYFPPSRTILKRGHWRISLNSRGLSNNTPLNLHPKNTEHVRDIC